MTVDSTRQDHVDVVAPRFDNVAAAPVVVGDTPYARLDAQIGAACENARQRDEALKALTAGVAGNVKAALNR